MAEACFAAHWIIRAESHVCCLSSLVILAGSRAGIGPACVQMISMMSWVSLEYSEMMDWSAICLDRLANLREVFDERIIQPILLDGLYYSDYKEANTKTEYSYLRLPIVV